MSIPHLTASALDALDIGADLIIRTLSDLIRGAEAGTVFSAPKSVLSPPDGRYIMATLAATTDPAYVATKSLVLNARNSERGLPQINSLVSLLDGETGQPIATIDGNWITAVRTAGISALAARHLARADVDRIGFVGTGVQAHSHLALFRQMFPLRTVKVYGRGRANLDAFCQTVRDAGLDVVVCDTPDAAITDVGIAISAVTHTSVDAPFLDPGTTAQGSLLISADLSAPWHVDGYGALDCLFVDDNAQEAALPTKLARPDDVTGDLADLVTRRRAGRTDPSQRTGFTFRGHALGDLALAILAFEAAKTA